MNLGRILPDLEHLFVIGGSGEDNNVYLNIFKRVIKEINADYETIYYTGTPIAELLPIVSQLPPKSAIFFMVYNSDANGNLYNVSNIFPVLSETANAPVFTFHDLPLGLGIIGGEMTSAASYGRITAETAVRIFRNNTTERVIGEQALVSQYDWKAMKRWGIEKDILPDNSEILFREETFFSKYRNQIIIVILLFTLETILIIALFINFTKRHTAERAFKRSEVLLARSERTAHLGGWDYDIESGKINYTKELTNILGMDYSTPLSIKTMMSFIYPDFKDVFQSALEQIIIDGEPFEHELRIKQSGGNSIWISAKAEAVKKNGKVTKISGTVQDINIRKINELQLQNTIMVKDSLLKEIHHRVKNNMTIITSLLKLQEGCIDDDGIRKELVKSQNRIRAMGLIHEQLYLENDLDNIHLSNYVKSIAMDLSSFQPLTNATLDITVRIPDIMLDIDILVPIGLIINEIVSNSIEHAFANTAKPQIRISMKQLANRKFLLKIRDNGSGLPSGFSAADCSSVGMMLVQNLILQINGEFKIFSDRGTVCEIIF